MFINHDLMVDNLLARGGALGGPAVTLEIARKFGGCVGCHEPSLLTMESGWMSSRTNLPAALEFVLTNGWSRIHHKKVGLETGDPRQFKSFEEVSEALKKQLAWLVRSYSIAQSIGEVAAPQPTVFTSALTEDCIEKGIAKEKGGARYNVGSLGIMGAVDVGNSLAAIRKLVFEEKRITMD